jgi:hypothetical protein
MIWGSERRELSDRVQLWLLAISALIVLLAEPIVDALTR